MFSAPKTASWCTPLLSVPAEAAEEYRDDIYDVQLTPGRSYPVLELDEESFILGSPTSYPITFFVRVDEPEHWSHFRFTDEPLPWYGTTTIPAPPTTAATD